MNFDRKSLSKLISLSDEELISMLKSIGWDAGIDTENLKIGKSDLLKIRAFLSMASDEDIALVLNKLGGKR